MRRHTRSRRVTARGSARSESMNASILTCGGHGCRRSGSSPRRRTRLAEDTHRGESGGRAAVAAEAVPGRPSDTRAMRCLGCAAPSAPRSSMICAGLDLSLTNAHGNLALFDGRGAADELRARVPVVLPVSPLSSSLTTTPPSCSSTRSSTGSSRTGWFTCCGTWRRRTRSRRSSSPRTLRRLAAPAPGRPGDGRRRTVRPNVGARRPGIP